MKAKDDELSERRWSSSARSGRNAPPRRLTRLLSLPSINSCPDHGSASVNCSSSVRWITEKLSSEMSVSTVSPAALR